MNRSEEYLRRAEDAEARSVHMRDPEVKRQFRDLARQWRDLARQAKQLGGSKVG